MQTIEEKRQREYAYKKGSLIQKYKEWSERPNPSFSISHLLPMSEINDTLTSNIVENASRSNDDGRNDNENFVLL